jgi:hypothetical protein
VIVGCVPLALALLGPALDGRAPSGQVVAAALVVSAGAAFVQWSGGPMSPAGLALSLGALACEAAFSLLAVPLLATLGPVGVSTYACAAAAAMLLAGAVGVSGADAVRLPTPQEAAAFGYLAVVVTAVGFVLWYSGVRRLGVERAGLFAGLVPVAALVTAAAVGAAALTLPRRVGRWLSVSASPSASRGRRLAGLPSIGAPLVPGRAAGLAAGPLQDGSGRRRVGHGAAYDLPRGSGAATPSGALRGNRSMRQRRVPGPRGRATFNGSRSSPPRWSGARSAASARLPRLPLQFLKRLPVVPALLLGHIQHGLVMLPLPMLTPAGVHAATPRLGLDLSVSAPFLLQDVLRLLALVRQGLADGGKLVRHLLPCIVGRPGSRLGAPGVSVLQHAKDGAYDAGRSPDRGPDAKSQFKAGHYSSFSSR